MALAHAYTHVHAKLSPAVVPHGGPAGFHPSQQVWLASFGKAAGVVPHLNNSPALRSAKIVAGDVVSLTHRQGLPVAHGSTVNEEVPPMQKSSPQDQGILPCAPSEAAMAAMVRQLVEHLRHSERCRERAIEQAARLLGIPHRRAEAFYYGEHRRIDAAEWERAKAATARIKAERIAALKAELAKLEAQQ